MINPQHDLNLTKAEALSKDMITFIEKNNRGYTVLEILIAVELLKYSSSDLPQIGRKGVEYGVINWTKVTALSKDMIKFLEKNNRGYKVLEILMAFEMVKYSTSDLPKIGRKGF